jgi:hypothetical protein
VSATLKPEGSGWAQLLNTQTPWTDVKPQVKQFRHELGLPSAGHVVMSGHQAQWWHAGILAKQIALAAVCKQTGAAPAWVIVDQDASDSLSINYPVAPTAAGGIPTRGTWAFAPDALAAHVRADVALGDLPAFTPSAPPTNAATPDIARGLRAIADCTGRWFGASNAAEQIARANAELAASVLGWSPPFIFATSILRTTAGRWLLEKMAEDPKTCVGAYNQAVVDSGVSTIAPLSFVPEKNRYELPLWQLSGRGGKPSPRRRVFAATLGETPLDSLAPRGILLTALLRWLGCDLFIHGVGGGATGDDHGYDKVGERWFLLWLGADLARSVVATSTVHLPMGAAPPTASELDVYAAHRRIEDARHAPRTLGDAAAQREKDSLVAQIAAATGVERHRLYRRLQEHLDTYRATHAAELQSAVKAAAETAARVAAELDRQAILRERTWPWPLLPRTMVLELQRRVQAQLE